MARRCVALVSGGLDSLLSVRVIASQGIEVHAVTFATAFGCGTEDGGSCGHAPEPGKHDYPNVHYRLCHLGQEYVDLVASPRFGYGKNMNPCIDCRVIMLRWARDYMAHVGASFVVTGEVVGQRPMTQRRPVLRSVDREAGLEGLVVRPLSARLLPPTIPEREGILDRSRLSDIEGRTRQAQFALAREYGLTDYPTPAGGCLLTDPGFSRRLRDLLDRVPRPDGDDIELLKVGRILRLGGALRAHIGRNHGENLRLEALARPGDRLYLLKGRMGPTALVRGPVTGGDEALVVGAIVRYGKAPKEAGVEVAVREQGGGTRVLRSGAPPPREGLQGLLVK